MDCELWGGDERKIITEPKELFIFFVVSVNWSCSLIYLSISGSVKVVAQFSSIYGMQAFGLFSQHIHQAVR